MLVEHLEKIAFSRQKLAEQHGIPSKNQVRNMTDL